MVFSYRAFFGGAREGDCLFCPERRSELKIVVHEDDELLVIQTRSLAGAEHWLIILHRHIRDIESLEHADLPLLEAIDTRKDTLLTQHHPDVPRSEIYVGYHRGHRALGGIFGTFGWPDIISVHHLHLHVIVRPFWYVPWIRYPFWFPGMWVSDVWVRERLRARLEGEGDGDGGLARAGDEDGNEGEGEIGGENGDGDEAVTEGEVTRMKGSGATSKRMNG